jgi:diacylglycerol kinase (ATP)
MLWSLESLIHTANGHDIVAEVNGCILYNPAAGSANSTVEALAAQSGLRLLQSQTPDEIDDLVSRACKNDHNLLAVAGGDGTISRVVHALMQQEHRPILAVLPMGTGNDLARTLDIPDDPRKAFEVIQAGEIRRIDLIRVQVETEPVPRWCVNVAAGGFTGQMNEIMTDELKRTWGPLAYLRGAVKVLPDLKDYHTMIKYDDARVCQEAFALSIIIANGRTAGGGTPVAPDANPEDGLLDVVIVRNGPKTQLAGVAARLLAAGDYRNSDLVSHRRVKRVAVRSSPGMWFNIDGELISKDPISFGVVPKALRVVVGADYQAKAA